MISPRGLSVERFGMEVKMETKHKTEVRQLYAGSYNAPVLTGDGTIFCGDGKGITRYEFDESTGELLERESLPEAQNASWMALSSDGKRLYAVNELDDYEGTKGGALSAYEVKRDGSLRFLNRLPVMGAAPCHVDCAPKGQRAKQVYTANYNGGSMSAFRLREDGSLESLEYVLQHSPEPLSGSLSDGSYPQCAPQKLPHVHSSSIFGGLLWITDLGLDTVEAYRPEDFFENRYPEKSSPHADRSRLLPPRPLLRLHLPEGCGPRSLAFLAHRIFVSCELSNEVAVLESDGAELTLLQKISALPEEKRTDVIQREEMKNHVGGILLSPDQRYLYVGNRGYDTIAVFAVEKSGLVPLQQAPSGGRNPRGFCLSPSGRWLLSANQDSGNLVVMKRDEKTGLLSLSGEYEARSVVCLLFAD